MSDDYWELLRHGKTAEGLGRMEENFESNPGTSEAMELGVAYLWTGKYMEAWAHFNCFNEKYPLHASVCYGMAGTAKWCLGSPFEAVDCWRAGLDSEFADTFGLGLKIPKLLYFCSVAYPNLYEISKVSGLLTEKLKDSRAKGWDRALAQFVVGVVDEEKLREQCVGPQEQRTAFQQWLADFYVGVRAQANGDRPRYREVMQRVGSVSWSDYDSNARTFLSKLWSEECFLARYEAQVGSK